MAGLRLPLHGRNHRHTGSDPIPNMLQWGSNVDTDELGLTLTGHGGFDFDSGGNGFSTETGGGGYSVDTGDGAGSGGNIQLDAGFVQIRSHFGNDTDIVALGGGQVEVASVDSGGTIYIASENAEIRLSAAGDLDIKLFATGTALTVRNHLADPIFRVDEDGDLHGKTGKALTFDL